MIPNIVKGGSMRGLMAYLVSPGKEGDGRNVHTSPHVIGGIDFVQAWHGTEELDQAAARQIADYLDEPRNVYGTEVKSRVYEQDATTGERKAVMDADGQPVWRDQHVWHCSLSIPVEDGALSAEKWDTITREFMDEMGFSEASGKAPCRWVAIHHGPGNGGHDHVHIAASMIREDGTRWEGRLRDWPRSQQVCRELELRHGLTPVDGRQRGTASRGDRPAEVSAAAAAGRDQTTRAELAGILRSSAVASSTEAEWLRRVQGAGVVIKPRFAAGTSDVVVGYRAALRVDGSRLDFYSGGQIGRDLSLPRIRECWQEPTLESSGLAAAEWQAAWRGRRTSVQGREGGGLVSDRAGNAAAERLDRMVSRLTSTPVDHRAWADAARNTAGALSAMARFDPANRDRLVKASEAIARTAQVRRPGGQTRQVADSGASLLLLAAARDDRGKLAAELLLAQLVKMAAAIAAYHRSTGATREADRIRRDAVLQLQAVQQGNRPAAVARALGNPLPNPLTPRPQQAAGANREDRHAGR